MRVSMLKLGAVGSFSAAALMLAGCGGSGNSSMPGSTAVQNGSTVTTQSKTVKSLKCFSAGSGSCSIDPTSGYATLNMAAAPQAAGSVAGIYFANSDNLKGLTISQIADISITFGTSTNYASGTPRFVIFWNGASDSSTAAFIYPVPCSEVSAGTGPLSGTVDVTGGSATCETTNGSGTLYSSWSDFVAAYGSAVITQPPYFLADASSSAGGNYIINSMTATAK
jgi:hypothetical protein